jgi:hypothetical protein
VAALTMPALVANYQEKVTITKLKKFYSVMSQAYQQALLEDDNPASWDLRAQDDPQGGLNFYSHLEPYLKITKYCGTGSGCWADTAYKYLNGADIVNIDKHLKYVKFILSDGSSVAVMPQSGNCNAGNMGVCAAAIVDVNGSKPPNQIGKDIFHFLFTKDSVIATGSQQSTWYPFTTCAKESASSGWGCAAWVIYNENLDYLHCTGLSWGGKTKCD